MPLNWETKPNQSFVGTQLEYQEFQFNITISIYQLF